MINDNNIISSGGLISHLHMWRTWPIIFILAPLQNKTINIGVKRHIQICVSLPANALSKGRPTLECLWSDLLLSYVKQKWRVRVSQDFTSPSKSNCSLFRLVLSNAQNLLTHTRHSKHRLHFIILQMDWGFFLSKNSINLTQAFATKCKGSINHQPPEMGETLFAFPRSDNWTQNIIYRSETVHTFFTPVLKLTLLMADCPWQLCAFLLSSQRNPGMLLKKVLSSLLQMESWSLYSCTEH